MSRLLRSHLSDDNPNSLTLTLRDAGAGTAMRILAAPRVGYLQAHSRMGGRRPLLASDHLVYIGGRA